LGDADGRRGIPIAVVDALAEKAHTATVAEDRVGWILPPTAGADDEISHLC
jgi:hypothetical protein